MELPPELAKIFRGPIAKRFERDDFSPLNGDERGCLEMGLLGNREGIPDGCVELLKTWLTPHRQFVTAAEIEEASAWLAEEFQKCFKVHEIRRDPASVVWAEREVLEQRTGGRSSALWELRNWTAAVLAFETGEGVLRTADEAEASKWTEQVESDLLNLQWKVRKARSRLLKTGYNVPDGWLTVDVRLFIEREFWRRHPCGQHVGEWVVKVSGPEDREALRRVLREIDAAILRMRCAPDVKVVAQGELVDEPMPCWTRAYNDWLSARRVLCAEGKKATDDACYDWLVEHREDGTLPRKGTWKRYLGHALNYHPEEKRNRPRAGRSTAQGSGVTANETDEEREPGGAPSARAKYEAGAPDDAR